MMRTAYGYYNISWNAHNQPSGFYFVKVEVEVQELAKNKVNLIYSIDPGIRAKIAIIFFLGEQHYVFRGNRQDYFSYLSSGLAFYNYNYSELIEIRNNFNPELNDKFYLKHISYIYIQEAPFIWGFFLIFCAFSALASIAVCVVFPA